MEKQPLDGKKRALCTASLENAPDFEFDMFYYKDVKSAVEWLKYYLKQRKPKCDSIKIRSLLMIINRAFKDVTEKDD